MIDFYYAPTPNGWKIAIMLEECNLHYQTILVNLTQGDQFKHDFLRINPNGKIPAIVDHDTDEKPISVFESGAILLYLSNKTNQFGVNSDIKIKELHEWLFWQAANLGPMAGQLSHFVNYAPEPMEYGLTRYRGEYERCLAVLENRLEDREYILGKYSIADMMIFPWAFIAKNVNVNLELFPAIARWRKEIKNRPAVRKAINLHKEAQFTQTANSKNSPLLFNQSAKHIKT